MAKTPYGEADAVHERMVQTVYKALTGSPGDCPRVSASWEAIGFQVRASVFLIDWVFQERAGVCGKRECARLGFSLRACGYCNPMLVFAFW